MAISGTRVFLELFLLEGRRVAGTIEDPLELLECTLNLPVALKS